MPGTQAHNPGARRAILTIAISAIALETALLGMVAPLLPEIELRTDAGDEALGLALAAYAIPILLISLPVGRLADRAGRRPLLLGGLILTGVGSIVIATSGALPALLAGRAIQGVGSTLSWVAALALVSDLARPGRKGEAIGFALAANSLGAIGGPALGGIVGGTISFEAPFILVSVIAAGIFVAGWFILPRAAALPPGVPIERPSLRLLLRPAAVLPAAVSALGAALLGLVDFVVPLDLDRRLGTTATAIGIIFGAVALVDALVAPPAGKAGDRFGRPPVALAGTLVMTASGVLLATLGTVAGATIALGVFAVGMSTIFAASVPWLDETFGELNRGLAYGGLNLIYALGYTIGPLLGGWLLGNFSADAAYAFIAVAAAAVALALAANYSRTRRRAGDRAAVAQR
ncbi:MAG: MFS transporter [Solirubrobacterales bacterium]|nr:MFS transporter [Solirubrobacterales bacterium]